MLRPGGSNSPAAGRNGGNGGALDLPLPSTQSVHREKSLNAASAAQEHRVFCFKLHGLVGWVKYLILASMVFLLSLSAAYCAELVFIQAGSYDICTYADWICLAAEKDQTLTELCFQPGFWHFSSWVSAHSSPLRKKLHLHLLDKADIGITPFWERSSLLQGC